MNPSRPLGLIKVKTESRGTRLVRQSSATQRLEIVRFSILKRSDSLPSQGVTGKPLSTEGNYWAFNSRPSEGLS